MRRPNVLLIVLDAVRADHLSCYGYPRPTTPALEALAARGVLFERAFSAAPWTPPSHASLFTGVYPSRHGVDVGENLHLDGQLPTLAEILSAHGYATFAVLPDAHLSRARGLARGFAEAVEIFRIPYLHPDIDSAASLLRALARGRDGRAYHSARLLKRWLRHHRETSHAPFFAFINFKTAHSSYRSPGPFHRRFAVRPGPDQDPRKLRDYASGDGYRYMAGGLTMSEADFDVVRSWYDGALACLDACVADLLAFLESLGADDDTLVIVTADHGENFGDHGLAFHVFCLYDSLLHVPLLMKIPGLSAGRRVASLVSLTDVLPTVLDVVGLPLADYPALEGTSLAPFDGRELHPWVFAEFGRPHYMLERLAARYPREDFAPFDRGLRAVRTLDLKLIVGTDGSEELYHLPSDPGEAKNVAAERPDELAVLRRALDARTTAGRAGAVAPLAGEDDAVMQKTLRDLGYF